jgi:hypothetical protein
MLTLLDLMASFPSLSDAPREVETLSNWFDSAGPTEQATHAAALVLQLVGVPGIEFSEAEALHVWDPAHRAAYEFLRARLTAEGL